MRHLALGLLALSVLHGCSSPRPTDLTPLEQDTEEHKPDLGRDVFCRSILVQACDAEGHVLRWGSGVEIYPTHVLTAAHVVEGAASVLFWTFIHRMPMDGWHYVESAAELADLNRDRDLALFRQVNTVVSPSCEVVPIVATPLARGEEVFVHDFAAETRGPVWKGHALSPDTIDISGRPGSSGAGVWVLRDGRYQLAGVVIAHSEVPPQRQELLLSQSGSARVTVTLLEGGQSVTHLAPGGDVRALVDPAKLKK